MLSVCMQPRGLPHLLNGEEAQAVHLHHSRHISVFAWPGLRRLFSDGGAVDGLGVTELTKSCLKICTMTHLAAGQCAELFAAGSWPVSSCLPLSNSQVGCLGEHWLSQAYRRVDYLSWPPRSCRCHTACACPLA